MNEPFEHHFSCDPVFDSVVALYAYDRLGNDSGVRRELSDSVVLLDFSEYAWTRSRVKSDSMKDWHKDNDKFRVRKVRKRPNELVCRKGHPMTPENTSMHNGAKTCKQCNASYFREWSRRKKEKKGLVALEK